MFLARVTGSVVSTQKVDSMIGQKLLVVEPLRVNEQDKSSLVGTGRTFVCVDTVGAGEGEVVLIVQGSSAIYASDQAAADRLRDHRNRRSRPGRGGGHLRREARFSWRR